MTPPAKAGGFSEERLLAPTAASQATAQVSPCGHLSRLAPEGPIQALKTNENAGIGAVGGAIAEALIATAFGILVAVPAVWLFNYFTNKVTSFSVEMENSASELVDYFIRQRGKSLRG